MQKSIKKKKKNRRPETKVPFEKLSAHFPKGFAQVNNVLYVQDVSRYIPYYTMKSKPSQLRSNKQYIGDMHLALL